MALATHAQYDTDGDGLADADESTLFLTNPILADSDQDGMEDGLEMQLGTSPRSSNSVFRLFHAVTLPGSQRQLCWISQTGQVYQLQNADSRTNGPSGELVWRAVSTVTATGTNTCLTLGSPAGLYRIRPVVATNNDALPPLLSLIQATPPLPGGTSAALSVVVRDLAGVVRVEFLDGANLLGTATRGIGDKWSFSWPLNVALNGRHHLRARAFDAAGNIGYSPVLAFDVSVGAQSCLTVGGVRICADSIVASNGTLRATGHLRAGGVTFSADTVLTIAGTLISGSGSVTVPGLGTVLTGSFDINATTGWLTVRAGTTPIYSGIVFNPRMTLNPTSLLLNVFSNSICSSGSVTLQVPNHVFGPATFTGTICFDPLAASLSAVGSMAMSSLSATGTATLLLRDSTFTLAGNARLASSNGDVYTVSNGVAQLRYALAIPTIAISGRLGIPEDISVLVQGDIAANGSMSLTGSNGQGSMNGFRFAAATGTLARPAGLNSVVTLQFNARLIHTNLNNYLVAGTVRSTGDIDIAGTGAATFPENIGSVTVVASFNPLNVRLRGNVFAGNVSNAISGTLLAPNYLKPVQFSGIMRADGSVDITGNSGPYTAATFGGALPAMDAPNLSFEERLFIGSYHLFSRNNQTAASVNLRVTRTSDASGGIATLAATATVTTPGLPPLTLVGTASSTGAASVTGSIVNQNCTVWGHQVNNLSASAIRQVNGVFTFNVTGGALVYSGLAGTAAQATGSISSDGSGFIDFTYNSCTLNGYTLQNVTLRLAQAANGTRSLSILGSGRLLVPGYAGFTVQVTGGLTNNGTFLLSGTTSASLTLSNLPVASLAGNATATLTHTGLTIAGNVSGGVLLRVPVVLPVPPVLLVVPATGPVTITGCVTVSPMILGQFRLESTAPDGSFSACLGTNGLNFPNAARLLYRGSPLTLPALPVFTVSASGDFSISVTAAMTAGFTLNGYGMPSLSFTLVRSGNITFAQNVSATVRAVDFNPGFSAGANFSVNGTLNSDGTFNLTGTGGSSLSIKGLPVDVVNASQAGSVSFRETGLTITGSLSGGVLGQVPAVTAVGILSVADSGHTTVSGCITVSPLIYGQFRLESTQPGGSFSACFGPNGLIFPTGARLLYRGAPLTLPALPEFTISVSGNFDINVSASMTAGITLNGYTLPSLSFRLVRSANVTVAQNVTTTLRVPGFNPGFTGSTDFNMNGVLNSDGTFNLIGTGGNSLALTGLPAGTANASAAGSVTFNETGLRLGGTLSGGLLGQFPVRSVAGSGLLAEYFDNSDFTGPKVTRVDSAIDFDWGNGQPDPAIDADTFSVRWTGWVQPQFSETYTFITTSDDGVRLWVNNQLLIDNWTLHGPTEDTATIALQAGQSYEIRMEFFDNGVGAVARLEWASASRSRQVVPNNRLIRSASGGGLLAEYFDNSDFTGPKVTRVDPAIDFDWGNGQPDAGIGADTFSARWTGWVQPEFSETYTFITTSDDGVRLWVNNQLLIDNWTDHAPTEDSASIFLQAGQYYDIRMEYFENGVGAVARLEWSSPSRAREIIPMSRLFQESPVATISGLLDIAANGRVTASGCVTVSPLVFGEFRLESSQPGGNFTACFGPDGLVFPANARLLYGGLPLTLPALPAFTVSASGSFSINVTAAMTVGVQLNGFDLPSLSFTIVGSGNVLAVQNLTATVRVPGLSGGFSADTMLNVSGSLNSNGTFNLTGNGGGSLTLSGLPIGSVNASVANSVSFRNTGLTVAVSFSGGVLNTLPAGFTASGTLAISRNGSITLTGSVTCPALQSGVFTIERLNGGNLQATLDNFGLRFSNGQVRVSGVFNVAVSLPGLTINNDGSFAAVASGSPAGFTVAGFGFNSISFVLERSPFGTLSISGFNATLFGVTGFNQRFLNGTISNGGVVVMDLDASVTLGGFTSTSGGHLALRNSGLTASGNFTIGFGSVAGSFSASVAVSPVGGYSGSANASLTIGSYTTSGSPMTLTPSGLSGPRTLNMNSLQVPLPNLFVTPSSITGGGSKTVDSDWRKFVDPPFTDFGDLWGRTIGNVTVNLSGNGTISLSHSLTLHWWWGRFLSDPPQLPGQFVSINSGVALNQDGTIAFTHGVTCPCGTFFESWSFDLWN